MNKVSILDKKTGIVEITTSNEIAERLGISRAYVNSCIRSGSLIQNRYKVKLVKVIDPQKNIPCTLWNEWDRVCEPINKALKNSGKSIKLICPDLGV